MYPLECLSFSLPKFLVDINSDYASSLEAIHDKIHGYVGGDRNGHMGNPEVAGMSDK